MVAPSLLGVPLLALRARPAPVPELDGLGELRAERSGEGEGSMASMDRVLCLPRRALGVLLSGMSRGSSERMDDNGVWY